MLRIQKYSLRTIIFFKKFYIYVIIIYNNNIHSTVLCLVISEKKIVRSWVQKALSQRSCFILN